jgi:hypothetical protein
MSYEEDTFKILKDARSSCRKLKQTSNSPRA